MRMKVMHLTNYSVNKHNATFKVNATPLTKSLLLPPITPRTDLECDSQSPHSQSDAEEEIDEDEDIGSKIRLTDVW